jgi:hypothetical protein
MVVVDERQKYGVGLGKNIAQELPDTTQVGRNAHGDCRIASVYRLVF